MILSEAENLFRSDSILKPLLMIELSFVNHLIFRFYMDVSVVKGQVFIRYVISHTIRRYRAHHLVLS